MEATNRPQTKVGNTEFREGSNEEQAVVWSQLEVGDIYQRQLDQLRQVAVQSKSEVRHAMDCGTLFLAE